MYIIKVEKSSEDKNVEGVLSGDYFELYPDKLKMYRSVIEFTEHTVKKGNVVYIMDCEGNTLDKVTVS
jgi:hypothetical protein